MLASRRFKVVLAFLLSLVVLATIVWISYLGPRVWVRTFSVRVDPIIADLLWSDTELEKLFKEDPGQDLDFTKAEDREKFKNDMENISARLAQVQVKQKQARQKLRKLSSSHETEKLKESVVKLNMFGIESVPRLQALFDYLKELITIIDTNPMDKISDKEPGSLSEAKQQISELSSAFEKLADDINKLEPPPEIIEMHTQLQDLFNRSFSTVVRMKEGLEQSDEAKFLAATDEFDALEGDFASFDVEKSLEKNFDGWISKEDKLLRQVELESKELVKEFGPFWAITLKVKK
ncbi:MAG TPA: hypothetical protein ENI11_06095 [Actinobacteria bacterium]|nr:hypothetical protein [Actinomycetota bacterium]